MSWCGLFCDDKINVTETGQGNELAWDVSLVYPFLTGTGPLGCLSLFPVADVDKVSNEIKVQKCV